MIDIIVWAIRIYIIVKLIAIEENMRHLDIRITSTERRLKR